MRRLLWLLLAGCSPRLQHPEVANVLMARADLNGDGAVDPDEFRQLALPRQGFAPYDTNQDRLLDAAELERAFLETNPADFQDEGRRAVHEKYGHPFGRPGGQTAGRGGGKGKGKGKGRGKGRGKGNGGRGNGNGRGRGNGGRGNGNNNKPASDAGNAGGSNAAKNDEKSPAPTAAVGSSSDTFSGRHLESYLQWMRNQGGACLLYTSPSPRDS